MTTPDTHSPWCHLAQVSNQGTASDDRTCRRDDAVVDYCTEHSIAYLPWGTLAAKRFAREAPLTKTSGALAWLLRRAGNIVAIPGTTSLAHLEENVAAARVPLSDEEFASLSVISSDAS